MTSVLTVLTVLGIVGTGLVTGAIGHVAVPGARRPGRGDLRRQAGP
jgi:hypothetical protein